MRILFTSTRSRNGVHSSESTLRGSDSGTAALVDVARQYGFEYDVRSVAPGECLDGYDLIVVTLTNAAVQGNTDLYGALWALEQQRCGGPPAVINLDHWTIKDTVKSYLALSKNGYKKLWDGFIEYQHRDRAKKVAKYLELTLARMSYGDWPSAMTCAFPWGDHGKLEKGVEDTGFKFDFVYDPTYLHVDLYYKMAKRGPLQRRDRAWVIGAVSDHSGWIDGLGLNWRVDRYGWRAGGQQFISRDLLLGLYSEKWGGLSPPYYHAGSGYWRARLIHYILAGCVTLADPAEVPWLEFTVNIPSVERMTDQQLHNLALEQHLALISSTWDEKRAMAEISMRFKYLESYAGNDSHGDRPKFLPPEPRPERLL